jgi:hypothetical protein
MFIFDVSSSSVVVIAVLISPIVERHEGGSGDG